MNSWSFPRFRPHSVASKSACSLFLGQQVHKAGSGPLSARRGHRHDPCVLQLEGLLDRSHAVQLADVDEHWYRYRATKRPGGEPARRGRVESETGDSRLPRNVQRLAIPSPGCSHRQDRVRPAADQVATAITRHLRHRLLVQGLDRPTGRASNSSEVASIGGETFKIRRDDLATGGR